MIRILGFYKRLPGISREKFLEEWAGHGEMIRNSATISRHIERYVQHSLSVPDAFSGAEPGFAYDGFSEVWVESMEHYAAMRAEPELLAMGEHTREFIDIPAARAVIDEAAIIVQAVRISRSAEA